MKIMFKNLPTLIIERYTFVPTDCTVGVILGGVLLQHRTKARINVVVNTQDGTPSQDTVQAL